MSDSEVRHIPILVEPIVQYLVEPFLALPVDSSPYWIVDCTFGGGGHTGHLLSFFESHPQLKNHKILGLDQDSNAIERGEKRFAQAIQSGRLELKHLNFRDAQEVVQNRPALGLLADLGFSSDQLEDIERGLSFMREGPLDMRLNQMSGVSCYQFLREVSEKDLEMILREYGEERFAHRIAAHLVHQRRKGVVPQTTKQLADLVIQALPPPARHGRIHAATRTFQALRIAVNQELEALDDLLEHVIPAVTPGGRVAILSFHSLEDRRVKQKFKLDQRFKALTKKPIEPSDQEVRENSRARSAKLRVAQRSP